MLIQEHMNEMNLLTNEHIYEVRDALYGKS